MQLGRVGPAPPSFSGFNIVAILGSNIIYADFFRFMKAVS